jgi:UDP-glucose 4-epimerase
MKALITGGLGFIGGRLASYLSALGVDVLLGTRNIHNRQPEWLASSHVVHTEWSNRSSLEFACKGVDVVVHAAGMNAVDSATNPVDALAVNGLSTANLLYSAIASGVQRFLYISTGHVYNAPLQGDIFETNTPLNLHPYASSHRAGEDCVRYAHQQHLVEGCVIRLSNGYGFPMHEDVNCWMLLVNDLCRQAVTTSKMALQSSGVQQRDFIPMKSVVEAIYSLIISDKETLDDGLYNIGCGQSMSVWEMACLVQRRCEKILCKKVPLSRSDLSRDRVSLNYVVQKYKNIAPDYEIDHIKEIDCLIDYCIKHFSNTE